MFECVNCIHFVVCSRRMGGMDLVKCEDYNEPKTCRAILKTNAQGYIEQWCDMCHNKLGVDAFNYCPYCGCMIMEA